jgi:uncharacterized membrane protein
MNNPAVDRYLTSLSNELGDVPEPERTEVLVEIRNHAAEAMRAGEEPADVIERFGDPRQLANAYRVELAVTGARHPVRRVAGVFALLAMTAATSLGSFIVIVVLGALTLGFIGGGVAAIVAGVLSLFLPGDLVTSALAIPQTISELLAIGGGVVLTIAGLLAGVMLFFYVRMVVRAFRRMKWRLRARRAG